MEIYRQKRLIAFEFHLAYENVSVFAHMSFDMRVGGGGFGTHHMSRAHGNIIREF